MFICQCNPILADWGEMIQTKKSAIIKNIKDLIKKKIKP